MLVLESIANGNASGKNKEAWAIINDYAPPRLENLEGIKGLYDCQYYKDKYHRLYMEDPENCELINRLIPECCGVNAIDPIQW